jgi:tripartite-type tricarboxylate transporter receptor subunit TctC
MRCFKSGLHRELQIAHSARSDSANLGEPGKRRAVELLEEQTLVLRRYDLAIAVALGLTAVPTAAQAPGLAAKTVTLIIGLGPGSGYTILGRAVARHLGKHLPGNPTVVVQNMPGGGSLNAANHIYAIAPKDGSVLGLISRDAPLAALAGVPGARFDPIEISWIGTPTVETNICISTEKAKVKTFDDLRREELIVGTTGAGAGTYSYPKALNGVLGTKFKLVTGFPSSSDVLLAMERGEVEGICESFDSLVARRPGWIEKRKVNVLFQGGAGPNPRLQGVPFILDLAGNADKKQALEFLYSSQGIGRPFVAPPGLPPERLKMLRDAFDSTMKDPDFLAEAKALSFGVEPEDGAHLEALIRKIYATPKAVGARIGELIK